MLIIIKSTKTRMANHYYQVKEEDDGFTIQKKRNEKKNHLMNSKKNPTRTVMFNHNLITIDVDHSQP